MRSGGLTLSASYSVPQYLAFVFLVKFSLVQAISWWGRTASAGRARKRKTGSLERKDLPDPPRSRSLALTRLLFSLAPVFVRYHELRARNRLGQVNHLKQEWNKRLNLQDLGGLLHQHIVILKINKNNIEEDVKFICSDNETKKICVPDQNSNQP